MAEAVRIFCNECQDVLHLPDLHTHRTLHKALDLFGYDIRSLPTIDELTDDRNRLISCFHGSYEENGRSKALLEINKQFEFLREHILSGKWIGEFPEVLHQQVSQIVEQDKVICDRTCEIVTCHNELWRPEFEDFHCVTEFLVGDTPVELFALFEGYHGDCAARLASEKLPGLLKEQLSSVDFTNEPKEISCAIDDYLTTVFNIIDKYLSHGVDEVSRIRWSGCSACVCLKIKETLHVANVGNVHALSITRKGIVRLLTNPHTLHNQLEFNRIRSMHPKVHVSKKSGLINGVVSTTRGLGNYGDPILKSALICQPEITSTPISDECFYLVMSTSSLFKSLDIVDIQTLVELNILACEADSDRQKKTLSALLVQAVLALHCHDNSTVISYPLGCI